MQNEIVNMEDTLQENVAQSLDTDLKERVKTLEIEIPKYWVNDAFYPLLFDKSRYLVLRGGAGSGKSYFAVDKIIYRILKEGNKRFIFVRAVRDTLRNSVYSLFKSRVQQLGLAHLFQFRDSLLEITCESTNSNIICIGMNDRERIKSLADPTDAWIEEATELDDKDFYQLNMRLRTNNNSYRQTIVTFNPVDADHWIRRDMFPPIIDQDLEIKYENRQRRRKWAKGWIDFTANEVASRLVRKIKVQNKIVDIDYTLHLSSYEDNRFLDDQYKAELEDLRYKDINFWNIYAKAKWGSIGNLVFNPSWQILHKFPEPFDDVVYGIDFGFNHPSTLMECGYKDGQWYVKELAYLKRYTNMEFINYVKTECSLPENALIYCDNAEPARIKEWEENTPYDIRPAVKGNDSVKATLDYLKSLKIYSHVDNLNLNREMKTYKWKTDKQGKPLDEPLPLNDDCIKAVGYAIYNYSKQNSLQIGFID